MFAGPFSSGAASELALFQIPPGTSFPTAQWVSSSASSAGYVQASSPTISWQLTGAMGRPAIPRCGATPASR